MSTELVDIAQKTIPSELGAAQKDPAQIRSRLAERLLQLMPNGAQNVLLIANPQVSLHQFSAEIARRQRYFCFPPYGLGKLTTYITERGYNVSLLDLNYETIAGAAADKNLDVAAMWQARLEETIDRTKPDLIGVSSMFTMGYSNMMMIVDMIKSYRPDLPIILGGVHATNALTGTLEENKNIDLIATYEAEQSFPDMLDFVNGKKGEEDLFQLAALIEDQVHYVSERRIPAPEVLNKLPTYLDLPIENYSSVGEIGNYRFWMPPGAKVSNVLSNRGCRAHCSFCSVSNFNGKKVRARSIESVITEIQFLQDTYGIKHICWLDDDLLFNAERAISLFNEIVRRNLKITWDASNGVIASACTPEIIAAAVESGLIGMHVGVESGNEQILRDIHKPSGVKHFLKLGELMDKYPQVFTRGYLIIGFPNESYRMIMDTVKLAHEMRLDWYSVATLTPLPNTEIFETMVDLNLIDKDKIDWKNNYYSPTHGKQTLREEREKLKAQDFENFFSANLDVVPGRELMDDLWFLTDYKINYERIVKQQDPVRLKKLQALMTDVSERMTWSNPMSNLFLAIIESRLGNFAEAKRRKEIANSFLESSAFWQKRFGALNLESLISEIKTGTAD